MLFQKLLASGFLVTACLLGEPASAIAGEQADGQVSHVTLYRNQALVTRTIQVGGEAGNSEVVIGDLPENVVTDSLFAEGAPDLEVRAVQFRTRAVGESPREEVREMQKQIVQLQDQLELNQKNIEIANQKIAWLDQLENTVAPPELPENPMDAEELERMTVFLFEQRALIAPRQIELNREHRELGEKLALLQRQFGELTNGSTKTVREAVLFLSKSDDARQEVRLNYLVNNCGWSPTYTIRSGGDRSTAMIDYNGLIFQKSGEDWKNVSLTLSTASPALSAAGPGLAPLRFTLVAAGQNETMDFRNATKGQIGEIVSKQQQALHGNRYATNFQDFNDSSWLINEAADQWACVEMVGNSGAVENLQAELDQMIDEPSLTYQLDNAVTLTSRSSRQMVRIVSSDLPSEFYHVATPVLTSYVYREAQVTNNSSEDLLGGPITVYLDGRFVGRGEIPTVARGQTFVVGFGADPQLRARRELVKKDDGINGGNRELRFDYRLVVENFKDSGTAIRLIDRIPTSKSNRNIRITRNDFSMALSDDELYQRVEKPEGILRWDVEVPAGAAASNSHVVEYSYTVEYDRNYVVALPGKLNQQKQEFEQLQRVRTVR